MNRRKFIGNLGATGVTIAAAIGNTESARAQVRDFGGIGSLSPKERRRKAFELRRDAAVYQRDQPLLSHITNGDENIGNFVAVFSKTLPHNHLGEVDPAAYRDYLRALDSGCGADFEAISMGGTGKLANPQASYAFVMEGADSQQPISVPPPRFSGSVIAAEIVEDYWLALTRDVPFAQYGDSPLIEQAANDLSKLSDFRGPTTKRRVTSDTIFRGATAGDLTGPYISQFLLKPVPYGMTTVEQRYKTAAAGVDFITSAAEWLSVENGGPPSGKAVFDDTLRYIRNGRDLASYVHSDFSYQAPLNAALTLLSFGSSALSDTNPYLKYKNQSGFITFGAPQILDWVGRVSTAALKCCWCEKWLVHRRIRPEEFAGRIHNHVINSAKYSLNRDVLNSGALAAVFSRYGSYFLPQAYPEGCPTHPSYPAGHAVLLGAGVTILKAFFRPEALIPNPVVSDSDGLSLLPYSGPPLTISGELDKLAANIALGRDTAGVHYRTDGEEGLRLGEAAALGILHDLVDTFTEDFDGFRLIRFDGDEILIRHE
jgi:hypothetical protein